MPTKAINRKRKAAQDNDVAEKRKARAVLRVKEQERMKEATCFWRFPREIRDIIYAYVLGTANTSTPSSPLIPLNENTARSIRSLQKESADLQIRIDALDKLRRIAKKRNTLEGLQDQLLDVQEELLDQPLLLKTDALVTCEQMFHEMSTYIFEKVPIKVRIRQELNMKSWTKREEQALEHAQHIRISYNLPHSHQQLPQVVWTKALKDPFELRSDIKTFHFKGTGMTLLVHLDCDHAYPMGWTWCDEDIFAQALKVIEGLPIIKASKHLQVTWKGDERFSKHEQNAQVQEFRKAVKEFIARCEE